MTTVNSEADGIEPHVRPYGPDTAIAVRRARMKDTINQPPYPRPDSYVVHGGNGIVVEHNDSQTAEAE